MANETRVGMGEEGSLTGVLNLRNTLLFLPLWNCLLTLVMWQVWLWPGCSGPVWSGLVSLLAWEEPRLARLAAQLDLPTEVGVNNGWKLQLVSTQDNCTLSSGHPWTRAICGVCIDFSFPTLYFSYLTAFLFVCLSTEVVFLNCYLLTLKKLKAQS